MEFGMFNVAKYSLMALFLFAWIKPGFQQTALVRPIPVGSVNQPDPNQNQNPNGEVQPGIQMTTRMPTRSPPTITGSAEELDKIRSNMVGGATAIRDSIIGLIAFLIGGAKRAVENQVQGVVNTVQRVANKTILVKDNLQAAGGAIVHAFGDSIRQTGNITGELVNSLSSNQRLRRKRSPQSMIRF